MEVLRPMAMLCLSMVMISSLISMPVVATRSLDSGCVNGFYRQLCPNVESIIFNSMQASYNRDNTVAPGVLWMAYHDCFVRGCDAPVLLDGPGAVEKNSTINASLMHFEAIDGAKEAVEAACPGVVSCSDVIQFAARDAVVLTGGQTWTVPAGRRDGIVSHESEVAANLMTADKTVPVILKAFQKKGLNAAQMVALTGAHTIGSSPCLQIDNRIHGKETDPSLPASFASSLEKKCPMTNIVTTLLDLDPKTPKKFDTQFFTDIVNQMGLLTSDQSMWEDSRTKGQVMANTDSSKFNSNFAQAMVALSKVDVLTGQQGEIRRQCRMVN